MKIITINELSIAEKVEIMELWNNEYPDQLTYDSIEEFNNYLDSLEQPYHVLLKDIDEQIRGWYFDFYRKKEKWFVIILDSAIHGKGYGAKIINMIKEKNHEINGWVIDHDSDKKRNGHPYNSPLGFYMKNGFQLQPKSRIESDKISAVRIRWKK